MTHQTIPATKQYWQPVTRGEFEALEARKLYNRSVSRLNREDSDAEALRVATDAAIQTAAGMIYSTGDLVQFNGQTFKVDLFVPASQEMRATAEQLAKRGSVASIWISKPKGHKSALRFVDENGEITR